MDWSVYRIEIPPAVFWLIVFALICGILLFLFPPGKRR